MNENHAYTFKGTGWQTFEIESLDEHVTKVANTG